METIHYALLLEFPFLFLSVDSNNKIHFADENNPIKLFKSLNDIYSFITENLDNFGDFYKENFEIIGRWEPISIIDIYSHKLINIYRPEEIAYNLSIRGLLDDLTEEE